MVLQKFLANGLRLIPVLTTKSDTTYSSPEHSYARQYQSCWTANTDITLLGDRL